MRWDSRLIIPKRCELNIALDALGLNWGIREYVENVGANEATDYNLWRATRKLKQPRIEISPLRKEEDKWAESEHEKAAIFAKYFMPTFTPNCEHLMPADEDELQRRLGESYQLELPIKLLQNVKLKTPSTL